MELSIASLTQRAAGYDMGASLASAKAKLVATVAPKLSSAAAAAARDISALMAPLVPRLIETSAVRIGALRALRKRAVKALEEVHTTAIVHGGQQLAAAKWCEEVTAGSVSSDDDSWALLDVALGTRGSGMGRVMSPSALSTQREYCFNTREISTQSLHWSLQKVQLIC